MVNKHTQYDLKQMQSLPLEAKVRMTKERIRAWYEAWHKFEIVNKKTGKTRFATIDTRSGALPKLRENEYIQSEFDGQVYVGFSGGKDSTVLLHIAREVYSDIEAVFVNTGLEYPEIQKFVKTFDNVTILRPEMRFDEVIKNYGYPLISKEASERLYNAKLCIAKNGEKYVEHYYHIYQKFPSVRIEQIYGGGRFSKRFDFSKWKPLMDSDFNISNLCCNIMKKKPFKKYAKQTGKLPITAQMADESQQRKLRWMQNGCNGFEMKSPISNPMSFWTEQDVLQYIKKYNIPIASVYGDIIYEEMPDQLRLDDFGYDCGFEKLKTSGCKRTGCIFCAFGCHLEKSPSRFEMLKETHPHQYEYCLGGGEYNDNGVWVPNKRGLGMKHVFDELNKIYGEGFIKY